MEMHILREDIPIEKVAAAGRSEALVEGSIALEGGLRQVVRVLYAGGSVLIRQAEARQDWLHVRGQVQFRALYAQEGTAEARALEATADFDQDMELPGCTSRCTAEVIAQVRGVEASVYGGQMNLRARLALQAACMQKTQVNAVTGIADVPGLELQSREVTVRQTAARGENDDTLREELELPAGMADSHTLFATAHARVDEVSGGEGRASVTGEVQLEVWHAGGEGMPLTMTRHTIPFEECVQLCGQHGDELHAAVQVTDAAVASQAVGDDERILRAEVQLHTTVEAVSTDSLTLLEDAYTTTGDTLALTRETVSFRTGDHAAAMDESAKVMLLLPDDRPMRQVLAAFAAPEVTAVQQSGSRMVTEGMLHVTLVGISREDGSLISAAVDTPFRQAFGTTWHEDDAVLLEAADTEARMVSADRAELRCTLHLQQSGTETAEARLVTAAAQQPAEAPSGSIVLYFVQPGDTLWSIARHYRVSEASIRSINPELNDEVRAGQGVVVWRRTAADLCV